MFSSKLPESYLDRRTPEDDRKVHRPKRCNINNNYNENNLKKRINKIRQLCQRLCTDDATLEHL